MNFLYPIYTAQTECQDCYKCVRRCPCKAIRVESGHAMVMPEICVLCGRCVMDCPAKAKHVRDDLNRAKQLFKLKKEVYVSLAPSFAAEFQKYQPGQIIAMLKKLGFKGVSETALGADLVSYETAQELEAAAKDIASGTAKRRLFLSSACPAVVEYIKQQLPEYAPNICKTASPLLAHARYLKKVYGEDAGVVFIGPCIAKKREADVWGEIDAAITFNDLKLWLQQEKLTPETVKNFDSTKECFVPARAAKSALYPVEGGMNDAIKYYLKNAESSLPKIRLMSFSGIDEIGTILGGIKEDALAGPLFIEFLSCVGGCVNGPGTAKVAATALKRMSVIDYAEDAASTLSEDLRSNTPDMTGVLPVESVTEATHTTQEIQAALRSVGKYSHEDELNCGCCGYDTCRAFACAMLDKRAEKTMCLSYMRKLAQKKANGLIQAIPSGVVIADRQLNIVESNINFAKLMGTETEEMWEVLPGLEGADLAKITDMSRFFSDVLDEDGPDVIDREFRQGKKIFHVTVFAIEKEELAGGVIADITAPQGQKNRIVSQAKKVIDKNLSVVQKIAYLLGENAAETESMLNSIIESFSDEEKSKQ